MPGDAIRFSLTADTGCNSDEETKPADINVAENNGGIIVVLCECLVD